MGHLLSSAIKMQGNPPQSIYGVVGGSGTGFSSASGACGASTGGPTVYIAIPYTGTGSRFYSNPYLTIPFNGGNLWYKIFIPSFGYNIIAQINSVGVQISSGSCT